MVEVVTKSKLLSIAGIQDRVFVTFPRFQEGIPVTLGTLSQSRSQDGSILIEPYPDISWHMNPTLDCNNKMVSVFRIAVGFVICSKRLNRHKTFSLNSLQIDECQRLWVVDTGKLGLSTAPSVCPPKILVFNLLTNTLIHRYIIPRNQYIDRSFFINPVSVKKAQEMKEKKLSLKHYFALKSADMFAIFFRLSMSVTHRRVIVQTVKHTLLMLLVLDCSFMIRQVTRHGEFKIV